jgi:hypothetical protein
MVGSGGRFNATSANPAIPPSAATGLIFVDAAGILFHTETADTPLEIPEGLSALGRCRDHG